MFVTWNVLYIIYFLSLMNVLNSFQINRILHKKKSKPINIFNKNKLLNDIQYDIDKVDKVDKIDKIDKVDKIDKKEFFYFGNFPRLETPNDKGQLTWYPIGFSVDFGIKPKRVTIRDINYIVWKDKTTYYGLRDCCSHQGSSFMLGNTFKNTIICPYHGYVFDGINGDLIEIPKLPHMESQCHNINYFKVVERGDVVYLNTISIQNETIRDKIDETCIFVEPEYYDKTQRAVYLDENFEHYGKFVTVNSLDICHIGFVHTFGNRKNPNPLHNSKVLKMNSSEHHYKIIYEYIAGENSLVSKIYNFENITVENEYTLPHSTVARVKFGNWSSTIITHALPISKFKTKLFVKAYRNYLSYDMNDIKNQNILYPLLYLINTLGDKFTKNTMFNTLKEDKSIVDNIDKTNYHDMHGKFSIVYDLFSNHYKGNYKKFYEEGPLQM